jgi:hypothetical protein
MIGQALGLASHTKADGSSNPSRPGMAFLLEAQLLPGTGIVQLTSRDNDTLCQSLRLAWNVVRTRAVRIRQLLGITTPLPDLIKMDVSMKASPFGLFKAGTSCKHTHICK